MACLTPGERMVRCLLGQPVDRVPFGVGLGWWPWGETMARWRAESGEPQLDIGARLGYDASFAIPALRSGPWPEFAPEVFEDTPEHRVYRNERGIILRQIKNSSNMPEWLDYPVKSRRDWEELKATRYRVGDPGRLAEDWPAFRARVRVSGEAVQVGAFPWGVFGTVRDLLGVERLLVGFYDEPDLIREMMDHLTSLWLALWEQVASEVRIDHIHIWEDMAGRQGSLISMAMVAEFMMPCYDRIAEFARRHGVRIVSVDSDGDCHELVATMVRHGINMFLPFEVQAGNDVREFRRDYPELGIWGGLDKRALAVGAAALDGEVARCREMIGHGRFVPMFDHLIPPDVPWKLMCEAAERIRPLCDR